MAEKNLRPIGNKLIVKIEEIKTQSAIVLVNENQDKFLGTVIRVGSGDDTKGIEAGERVWFGKFSGTEIMENIYVLNVDDVLAVEEIA